MTDPVTCPHCREHLDIPAELRGRAVRCASCQNVFTTPPLPSGDADRFPPPERTDDRPPPRRDRSTGADLPPPRRPRQSNGGVWVLLLLTTLVLGGCVAGCVGFVTWVYNPKFHPFVSKAGKFQVEFPDDPNPAVDDGQGSGAITVTGRREQTQERYVVKCYPLPAKLRQLPEEEKLTELVKAELTAEGVGAELNRENTTHDGFPALDVMASNGGDLFNRRVTILRCVLTDGTVYVAIAQGQNLEPQAWWVRKFFLSLTLTDRPNPAGENAEPDEPRRKQD